MISAALYVYVQLIIKKEPLYGFLISVAISPKSHLLLLLIMEVYQLSNKAYATQCLSGLVILVIFTILMMTRYAY